MRWSFLVLALAACTPVKLQPVVHDCPVIVDYTPRDLDQAAAELMAMQDANHYSRYPTISRMMTDYGRERAALRSCETDSAG